MGVNAGGDLMFTGIVEELAHVASFADGVLRVQAKHVLNDVSLGDSIAVNGCCLTVVAFGDDWWQADVSEETVSRTTLAHVSVGDPVNLERAVRMSDRMGGHLVQGHVDAVGEIVAPWPDLHVRAPEHLTRYIVEKGSITVDGVSLTVVDALPDGFTVAVIPHTAEVTTIGTRQPGDHVNLEVDVMAKYVERLVVAYLPKSASAQGDQQ